jgi:WD40 repeat protein/class 3 adenylate cyclase
MSSPRLGAGILTFLIADVRGYTAFTQARGDEAAARLASKFAEISREGVEAHGGEVIELRGDEALAVFASAREALRAAVDLQLVLADEVELDRSLPLRVGIGIDAGEAVPVDGGYRGGALNLAARLCSTARAGEILASQGVTHLARALDGVDLHEYGEVELKGLAEPVRAFRVAPAGIDPDTLALRFEPDGAAPAVVPRTELPPALDPVTPIVGRDVDVRRLRWAWRLARRGEGSVLVVAGPTGIGKTRLAAEGALVAAENGAAVAYVSFAATDKPAAAAGAALAGGWPAYVVLDDLENAGSGEIDEIVARVSGIERSQGLVLAVFDDERASPELAAALRRLAGDEQTLRPMPLNLEDIRGIAGLYLGDAVGALPAGMLESSGGVPRRVHEQVAEWAHSEAARRLGGFASRAAAGRSDLRSVEADLASSVVDLQLVQERARLYGAGPGRGAAEPGEAPYKGLASFDVGDAEWFFGRERLVADLIARLAGSSLLGVVGPSGSGKSSAVRAGLVPALRAGVLPGSERWIVLLMRPGEHPLRELDRVLWSTLPKPVLERMEGQDQPLRAVRDVLDPDERIVLVVDQFEEVFTTCTDEAERAAFIAALTGAARDPRGSAIVVPALRADFYGRCAADPDLAELLGANHVLVGSMTAEEYRRAIEQPALRVGVNLEPALVDALVGDVLGEAGALPLLSTALLELWDRRDGRVMRAEAYAQTGGVRGAVARLAEDAYSGLDEEQQTIVRSVLLRLAGPGEGESVVRRRVPLAEFDAERNERVAAVLDVLTARRLLTVSEGSVEVAHEALLREWPRFQEWLAEDREGRRLHGHLMETARDWAERGRDPADLYRGARLASALDWTTEHTLDLNEVEREFVNASRTENERELTRQRTHNRRLRWALIGVGVLLLLAIAAGGAALVARSDAQQSATGAVAQRLGAQALVAKDLDLSLLLARQGVALDDSLQTRGNLEAALIRSPAAIRVVRPLSGRYLTVSASRDGRYLAVGQNEGALAILDPRTFKTVRTLNQRQILGQDTFTSDGRLIVFPPSDVPQFNVLDPRTGDERTLLVRPKDAEHFALAQSLRFFGTSGGKGKTTLREWSYPGKKLLHETPDPGLPIVDLESTANRLIVFRNHSGAFDAPEATTIEVWSYEPWRRLAVLHDQDTTPNSWAVDRSGNRVAVGLIDGSIKVTDLTTGKTRTLNGRHNATVAGVGFSPDGHTLVSTADDKQVMVWDADTGQLRETFQGHAGRVFGPAFSPDGKTAYTDGLDGALIAWDLGGARRLGRPFRAGSGDAPDKIPIPFERMAISPDGKKMAAVEDTGKTSVVDLATLRQLFETKPAGGGAVLDVAWSPEGKTFATVGLGGHVQTWKANDGTLVRSYKGLHTPASSIAFSPDGNRLAAGADDFNVHLWDVSTGREVAKLKAKSYLPHVAFSPDGKKLVATEQDANGPQAPPGGVADVWSLPDGKPLYSVDIDNGYGMGDAAAFSPDGKLLATGGGDGVVRFWDAKTGKPNGRSFVGNPGWVRSVEFDPTGKLLLTAGTDGLARLWDVKARAAYGAPLPGYEGVENEARFSPDGTHVVAVYFDGPAIDWDIRPSSWERAACSVAGRALTKDEWAQYLSGRGYHPSCKG